MQTGTTQAKRIQAGLDDDRYGEFLGTVSKRFTAAATGPLFTTDVDPELLWRTYLDEAPHDQRQVRNCNACRSFVQRYGGLAIVADGKVVSAVWPTYVPAAYAAASSRLFQLVARASITGVFRSDKGLLGTPAGPKALEWSHLSVKLPMAAIWANLVQTADQKMAEHREEFDMLVRGLAEFPIETVRRAHNLLTNGQLYRSEKCEGVAKWLLDLHMKLAEARGGTMRENLIWQAVATAPAGFCHVRSAMIGTLLVDLQSGHYDFEDVRRRFAEKMNPAQYQRPTAPPTEGNIAQAEQIVAKLQSADALARRFATPTDVQWLWTPPEAPQAPPGGGVFGHLRGARKADEPVDTGAPPTVMTWEKFARTVLPTAEKIELRVPLHGPFCGMVTAQNPEAPPILQWDRPERRNPVSWYLYVSGSSASDWNIRGGRYHPVAGVVLGPHQWDAERPMPHHAPFALLALEGAKDKRYTAGAMLFPEILRAEYHGVRGTIEAFSGRAKMPEAAPVGVCGYSLQKREGLWSDVVVRVTSKGIISYYKLDRWD